jgi:glycosyltransferase involved in cell wall biosynthesis
MEFTFGIITNGNSDDTLSKVIESILKLEIPDFEILVVGNSKLQNENVRIIEFDETVQKAWITKKKNIITQNAVYENIVYLHDYIVFDINWYKEFVKYGNVFDICMNQILNLDGSRFRDWTLWPHNENKIDAIVNDGKQCFLPYSTLDLTDYMYISGSYWVGKKSFMLDFPLNEKLSWGEGEDVEWSLKVRKETKFQCNPKSIVRLLKQKDPAFSLITNETLLKIYRILNFE